MTNISRDLRTALITINRYLELLDRTAPAPNVREYCPVISERIAAPCNLTKVLFKYTLVCTTADELQFELINIKSVREKSAAGFYRQLSSRNITSDLQLTGDVIRQLDKSALRRVFDNLIGNA